LASPDPTYSLYPVLAELADVRFVTVPWGPGWTLPVDALLAYISGVMTLLPGDLVLEIEAVVEVVDRGTTPRPGSGG
jgi:hypothetical protein